jgi:phosphocarrier protein HPr
LALIQKEFTVKNRLGLHARPAALFVQATNKFQSSVKVRKGDQEVDGKSIMGLMMLAAEEGSSLLVIVDGPDEQEVLKTLEKLFYDRFGEKD